MIFKNYFLVGGAGFVGSHFIDAFLKLDQTEKVTVYDNFSSGKVDHYKHHLDDGRLNIINADVKNSEMLISAMQGHDIVLHFASNPDIARSVLEPSIDFYEGILLTHLVLEAMRLNKITRLIYTSGSGVYGDVGTHESLESDGNLHPISVYGASKLGGEAFISAYCYMFNMSACVFRFANVVGPRQTHGVGYDFVNKLRLNPNKLTILGDGSQSKSYIHIDDIVNAVILANSKLNKPYEVYNVATLDFITVKRIADIVVHLMDLEKVTQYEFTGGDRGWKGDVPIVRLNTGKIQSIGWRCYRSSEEAIYDSILKMLEQKKITDKFSVNEEANDTISISE